ncbi:Aste57867_13848 [Aphanomyces stellatus]|uniref:Aste57867_13848 protein n=1 Tax=Aphanomyces stellatus TaxID=120398 RepID=A0A485KZ74_9STRA|nr:hypothetical protein As57867_013797 [Aphanomyces stellatus]VFT90679.1 Aste57867_13848 [Aphanomyces stellatus]
MSSRVCALYRLRFRFSPPVHVPRSTNQVSLHVEVVDESGQSVSLAKALSSTMGCQEADRGGWVVQVHACDQSCTCPQDRPCRPSSITMTRMQSHATLSVVLPADTPDAFRFHACLQTRSTGAAPTYLTLGAFTQSGSPLSDANTIFVLPVWSDLISRIMPLSTSSSSDSISLRCFSAPSHPPLAIEERYGEAMASHAWDAGICLASYLLYQQASIFQTRPNMRVLEIAAGCGVLGLAVATMLPPSASIILTEKPATLPLLQRNVARHPSLASLVHVLPLEWAHHDNIVAVCAAIAPATLDVLLLADVLYHWAAHAALVSTVASLASPTTIIFLAHKHRSKVSTAALRRLVESNNPNCTTCIPAAACPWHAWTLVSIAVVGATEIFQLKQQAKTSS